MHPPPGVEQRRERREVAALHQLKTLFIQKFHPVVTPMVTALAA